MRNGQRAFVPVLAILVCLLFSCHHSNPEKLFYTSLTRIDREIEAGNTKKAQRLLKSLRSRAESTGQWFSLVKRERLIGSDEQSLETLRKALIRIPASNELGALMVDTLIRLNRLDEACIYADSIADSSFYMIAALAEVQREVRDASYTIEPKYWELAWRATGNRLFHRNAAVLEAYSGDFASACSLGRELDVTDSPSLTDTSPALPLWPVEPPDEAYFQALLCFDGGFTDQVFRYLPPDTVHTRNFAELALMGDAALKNGNTDMAQAMWRAYVEKARSIPAGSFSPIPWYNLAVTSQDGVERTRWLKNCLAYFPDYYPSVVSFVRSVPIEGVAEETDPVVRELIKNDFTGLSLEDTLSRIPVDTESARQVLSTAIATMEQGNRKIDTRMYLEQFRFNQLRQGDSIRSASEMWRLLELYPADRYVHEYAVWYLALIGDYESAFDLNRSRPETLIPFYSGMEAATRGDLERSAESFSLVANNGPDAWSALANIARIHEKQNNLDAAVDELSVASGMAPDDTIRSSLHYQAARLLIKMRYPERAISVLGYALELNRENYLAMSLLKELEAAK